MEKEAIKHFKGKLVKLFYNNNFNLIGTILEVYTDSILFRTEQRESIISLEEIRSVIGGF